MARPRRNDVIEIHATPRERESQDAVLVLTAAGIPHSHVYHGGLHRVLVPEQRVEDAVRELTEFAEENSRKRPDHPVAERRGPWWPGALVYAAIVILVYSLERYPAIHFPFRPAGRMDALAVQGGDWYRTVTALTLHIDFTHIVGNLFFGMLFGGLLAQVVGNGVAWGTILASGFLGNALNSYLRFGEHFAVGASTAVFGALGALVAWQWVFGRRSGVPWPKRLAPAGMGLALLAYVGIGDENTDVLAHVYGFLAGAGFGYLHFHVTAHRALTWRTQTMIGVASGAIVLGAWYAAWSGW